MSTTQPFTTIDDLHRLAQQLADGLSRLGEYKHPLAVRRGREGVRVMTDKTEAQESQQLKGAGRTYFFDIRKTKTEEAKPYLIITESRKGKKEGDWEKNRLYVFPEDAKQFADTVSEMTAKL